MLIAINGSDLKLSVIDNLDSPYIIIKECGPFGRDELRGLVSSFSLNNFILEFNLLVDFWKT